MFISIWYWFRFWIIILKSINYNLEFVVLLYLKIILRNCIVLMIWTMEILHHLLWVTTTFHMLKHLWYHKRAVSCFQKWNLICETKKDINVKTETDSHCQHKHYLFRFNILSDSEKWKCITLQIELLMKNVWK